MEIYSLKPFDMPAVGRRERSLKVLEEAAELCEAGKRLDSIVGPRLGQLMNSADGELVDNLLACSRQMVVDEMADLLQATVNMSECFCITDQEMRDACQRCNDRNRARGRI